MKNLIKKIRLLERYLKYKEKLNKNLFILSVKYDRICYKYNTISLTIMILSTISTFIEATRLTMTEYLRNNENTLIIDVDIFTLFYKYFNACNGNSYNNFK